MQITIDVRLFLSSLHPIKDAMASCTTLSVYVIFSKTACLVLPVVSEAGAKVWLFLAIPNFL